MRVSLSGLPPLQRRMVEAWLARFEENWHEQKLNECLRALPPQSSVRRPLLLAMIERDLEHQWSHGRQVTLESYLSEYPELGRREDLPVELIAAEFEVRHRHGQADLEEYAQRFPAVFDDLQILVTPVLEGVGRPDTSNEEAGRSSTELRLKLLTAPANDPILDPAGERRLNLLRAESATAAASVPSPAPSPSRWGAIPADHDVDVFLPPDLARLEPTQPLSESPAQTIWLDGDAGRDTDNGGTSPSLLSATPVLPVPPVLGRYQIERQLGRSGRGFTYQAVDQELGRRVALKVPCFRGHDAATQRERFLREARIAAGLSHPLLCPILEVGQCDGFDYLVMPLVEGDSLSDLMKARPIWPVRQAVDLFHKLTSAMDAAHRQGVIHRDLKPTNVLITPGEMPVIVGFGQAIRPNHAEDTDNAVYLAPEWLQGEPDHSSPRGDIYSLAAMLYQILSGQRPPHPLELPAPLSFPDDLSPELQAICQRAMSRDPELRHATMREFAQDLARFRETLKPSNPGARLSLSGTSTRLGAIRRPAAETDTSDVVPLDALPTMMPLTGPASAAISRVQQIRQMSSTENPVARLRPPPPPSRRFAWEWIAVGTISVLVLVVMIVWMSRRPTETRSREPNATSPSDNPAPQEPLSPPTPAELVRRLATLRGEEQLALVQELKVKKDPALTQAIVEYLVSSPWSHSSPDGQDRAAALSVLLAIDPLAVPDTLRRATKSPDAAVRQWAYQEIGRRIDLDTRARLLPVLLGGLKDANGGVRHLVAEQVRQLPPPHDASISQALFDRVSDALWGEPDSSTPDGGKNAALDALEEFAPNRVAAALNAAERSPHPEVRRWAAEQKARRSSP